MVAAGLTAAILSIALGQAANEMLSEHKPMKNFVLIFRQDRARSLSEIQKQSLSTEMRPWAQRINAEGRDFAPHILAPESEKLGDAVDAAMPPSAWPVTALLFVSARDLDDAKQVASSHPGIRYGSVVEVRQWARPAGFIPTQPSGSQQ